MLTNPQHEFMPRENVWDTDSEPKFCERIDAINYELEKLAIKVDGVYRQLTPKTKEEAEEHLSLRPHTSFTYAVWPDENYAKSIALMNELNQIAALAYTLVKKIRTNVDRGWV